MLTAVWLWGLPRLGSWPSIQARIRRDERCGIDPSAKFYTELDARHRLLREVTSRRDSEPRVFWIPSGWDHSFVRSKNRRSRAS